MENQILDWDDHDEDLGVYANFGYRLLAKFIDGLIVGSVSLLVLLIFGGMAALSFGFDGEEAIGEGALIAMIVGYLLFYLIVLCINWFYNAGMESSKHQATIGKKILNIKVTDMNGERLSFARATGRFFGKQVSVLTFYIGFIMQPFTERKQALHDLIAGTLVWKTDE